MTTTPLPELKEIRDLYAGLVGRGCTAVRASALMTPETRPGIIAATYVSHRAQVEAVVAVDVPLGAHLGASIGLVPPGPAQDAAAEGTLSDVLLENLSEVLNVTAALFNAEDAPHLKLAEVFDSTRGPLPGAQHRSPARRGDRDRRLRRRGADGGPRLTATGPRPVRRPGRGRTPRARPLVVPRLGARPRCPPRRASRHRTARHDDGQPPRCRERRRGGCGRGGDAVVRDVRR